MNQPTGAEMQNGDPADTKATTTPERYSFLSRVLAVGCASTDVDEECWATWGPAFQDLLWRLLGEADPRCSPNRSTYLISAERHEGGPLRLALRDASGIVASGEVPAGELSSAVPQDVVDPTTDPIVCVGHPCAHRLTLRAGGAKVRAVSVDLRSGVAVVRCRYRCADGRVFVHDDRFEPTRWSEPDEHGGCFGFADVRVDTVEIDDHDGRMWRHLPSPIPPIVRLTNQDASPKAVAG